MALLSLPFVRYIIVGGINTLLYAGLLFCFLSYAALIRPVAVASAFLIAMVFQYVANRVFTFNSTRNIRVELPKYLVAALVNYLVTLLIVFVSIDLLGASEAMASILASLLSAVTGYLMASLWVFKL